MANREEMEVRILQDQGSEPREPQTREGDCMPHGSHDRSLSRLLLLDLGEVISAVRVCGWIMTKAMGLVESLW